MNYDAWRTDVAKLLQHASGSGVREKAWRDHYIAGRSPEQAAHLIDTAYLNSLTKAERIRRLNTGATQS